VNLLGVYYDGQYRQRDAHAAQGDQEMNTRLLLMTVLLIATLLAGCAQIGGAETGAILEAGKGTEVLTNDDLAYAFLYPDTYTVEARETGDILVIGSIMNHTDPRLQVEVESAAGRTAAEVADAFAAGYPEGIVIERSTITLDGEEAVVVDRVPTQELSRFVFVTNGDRLYRFMFTHSDPALGDTYTRMENLYTVVTNSFRFVDE
jgi:hypothetical protein